MTFLVHQFLFSGHRAVHAVCNFHCVFSRNPHNSNSSGSRRGRCRRNCFLVSFHIRSAFLFLSIFLPTILLLVSVSAACRIFQQTDGSEIPGQHSTLLYHNPSMKKSRMPYCFSVLFTCTNFFLVKLFILLYTYRSICGCAKAQVSFRNAP